MKDVIGSFSELNHIFDAPSWLAENFGCEFINGSNGWKNSICPFEDHDDMTPSFGVNTEQGRYFCFGCGKSGDLIDLVSKLFKISPGSAIKHISHYSNVSVNSLSKFEVSLNKFRRAVTPSEEDEEAEKKRKIIQKVTKKIKKVMKKDFIHADNLFKQLDQLIELEDYEQIGDFLKT